MTTPLDTELVATALQLINEFGTDAVFSQENSSSYNAATQEAIRATPTKHTVKISPPEYLIKVIDGKSVTKVKFYIAASGLLFTPVEKMKVTHGTEIFTLENILKLYSGDEIAAYALQSLPN